MQCEYEGRDPFFEWQIKVEAPGLLQPFLNITIDANFLIGKKSIHHGNYRQDGSYLTELLL